MDASILCQEGCLRIVLPERRGFECLAIPGRGCRAAAYDTVSIQHQPLRRAQIESFISLSGKEAVGERVPFSIGARAGVEAAVLLVVAQSQVGVEGMALDELGIVALPTGLHGRDRLT